MQNASQISLITILVSSTLLLFFCSAVVYLVFLYQKRRYVHEITMRELQDSFSQILLQSKLEIQEATLDHIGKELHANFGQLISLIHVNLSALLPKCPEALRETVSETKSLTRELLTELKALTAGLNSDYIMHAGFPEALGNELDRIAKTKLFRVTFTRNGEEYRLEPEKAIILFRLCQEVLNNSVNYSNGTIISATLDYLPAVFRLELADDGAGFDVDEMLISATGRGSTGLVNIRKRAALINASVDIRSKPGEGTRVQIDLPRLVIS